MIHSHDINTIDYFVFKFNINTIYLRLKVDVSTHNILNIPTMNCWFILLKLWQLNTFHIRLESSKHKVIKIIEQGIL